MDKISIFIVGVPRSGTKLLRELLNNHSKIFFPKHEAYFIPHLARRYGKKKLNAHEVSNAVDEIKNSLFFFYYGKEKIDFEKFKSYNCTIHELLSMIWQELAIIKNGTKADILGDKTPRNINHIPFLMEYFNESRFIHIVRDPRDNVLSAQKAWNKNIFRAAHKWQKSINIIDKIEEGRGRLMEIRYEDLLLDTDTTLEKVCQFVDINYEKGMGTLKTKVALVDDKGAKIDKKNYNKYLRRLNEDEIRAIECLTKKGLQRYNYTINFQDVEFSYTVFPVKLYWWKLQDILSLLIHNIKKYGFAGGIEKIKKARRHA